MTSENVFQVCVCVCVCVHFGALGETGGESGDSGDSPADCGGVTLVEDCRCDSSVDCGS